MSASLVGSEMCIRDRGFGSMVARTAGPIRNLRAHALRRHRGHVCGHIPVSYTHLTLPTICSV
eukprot:11060733-Alexandrium_andersonii.AAC.1